MSTFAGSTDVEALWNQCLKVNHESTDRDTVIGLYQETSRALKEEQERSGPSHKSQIMVQRYDILRVWAAEVDLALP